MIYCYTIPVHDDARPCHSNQTQYNTIWLQVIKKYKIFSEFEFMSGRHFFVLTSKHLLFLFSSQHCYMYYYYIGEGTGQRVKMLRMSNDPQTIAVCREIFLPLIFLSAIPTQL